MRKPSLRITTSVSAQWAEGLAVVPPKPGRVNRLAMRLWPDGKITPSRIARSVNDIREVFWTRAIRQPNGCLLWSGSVDSWGYGTVKVNRKTMKAHRVAFFLANGELPTDRLVCHTCDTPRCIEPSHLFLGTDKANAVDCSRKGRSGRALAKLNWKSVCEIRQRFSAGGISKSELGRRYGVEYQTVLAIIKRKTWKTPPNGKSAFGKPDQQVNQNGPCASPDAPQRVLGSETMPDTQNASEGL